MSAAISRMARKSALARSARIAAKAARANRRTVNARSLTRAGAWAQDLLGFGQVKSVHARNARACIGDFHAQAAGTMQPPTPSLSFVLCVAGRAARCKAPPDR